MGGQTITDPGQVDTIIAEMTGLPSEKFLRSTASVRHQELEGLDKDEGALRDRLQQSISGADGGTNTARRQLNEAVRRYRSVGVRNPGLVRQARTELERLTMELAEGEAALTRLEADRTALALAHDRRSQLDTRLTRDQDALDAGERAVRLETSATDAEARYMRLRQAVDLQARITMGERDHPSSTPLPALKEGVRRLKELQFQIQELESDLELAAGPVRRARLHVRQAAPLAPGGAAGDRRSGRCRCCPGPGRRDHDPAHHRGYRAGVSCCWSSASRWGLGTSRATSGSGTCGARWSCTRPISSAGCAAEPRKRSSCASPDARRTACSSRWASPTSMPATLLLDKEAAHAAVIEELRAEMRGVLAGVQVSGDLAAERDRAATEMDQSRHALAGLGGVAQDPAAARVRAQQTLRQTQQEREVAIQEEGQAQGRVDQNSIDAERVALLAESVDATQERLAGLERRARVYELTLSAHRWRGAGDHEEGRPLPRGAHGRGRRPDHRRALPAGAGQ